MSVCCECCVLPGRGLFDELITLPEESFRLWCVVVSDLETSGLRRLWSSGGCRSHPPPKKSYSGRFFMNSKIKHFDSIKSVNFLGSCEHVNSRGSFCILVYQLITVGQGRTQRRDSVVED